MGFVVVKSIRLNDVTELMDNSDFNIDITASDVGAGVIGVAEDGIYTDGLFTDFVQTTPIGTAIDRFNEILSSLAPSPPPSLDMVDYDVTGARGYLSFDDSKTIAEGSYFGVTGLGTTATKVLVDQLYVSTSCRIGIINAGTAVSGTLNEDVAANGNSAYIANAWSDADQGSLKLELNGAVVRTVDLTTTGALDDGTATGFTLTDHTPVLFPNGNPLSLFQYRAGGTWRVAPSSMRLGWNYAKVIHTIGGSDRETNYIDWVVDGNSTAVVFTSQTLTSLVMGGSKYLSGVEYFTSGNAVYKVDIENAFRNTYADTSAVTFNETNIENISTVSFPSASGNELFVFGITQSVKVSATRLVNGTVSVGCTVTRTIQSDSTSPVVSISGILMDNAASSSTLNTLEDFNNETYRLAANLDFCADLSSSMWTGSESLNDSGAAGYNNGLQVVSGGLDYPDTNFNYSNAPASNKNYTTCTGVRYYYRIFRKPSGASSGFTMNMDGTGAFVQEGTLTTGTNEIAISIKLPTQTGWMDCTQNFQTDQWNDGDGCLDVSLGNSGLSFNDWNLSVGTKSTANSFDNVYLRITFPQAGTANITNLTWSFD